MKSDNSERKKAIRKALIELGGEATTAEIAKKSGLPLGHGITQTLNKMENIEYLGGKAKQAKWKTSI